MDLLTRQETWKTRVRKLLRYSYTDERYSTCYRLYQHKASGTPPNMLNPSHKRRKNFRWIEQKDWRNVPMFLSDLDSWMSFAIYHKRFTKRGFAAGIDCNFLFLSERRFEMRQVIKDADRTPFHKYIRTSLTHIFPEVLKRCKILQLPEPEIIYTADGLQLIWHWKNFMHKINYPNDFFQYKFNDDWETMQRKLFTIFEDLGADPRKLAITAAFRIPGSINTVQKLKTNDRIVRVIHQGQTLSSYAEMQEYLKMFKEKNTDNKEQKEIWQNFSKYNPDLARDWEKDILSIHRPGPNFLCFAAIKNGQIKQFWTRASNIKSFLAQITEFPEFKTHDIYMSQAQFSRKSRKINCVSSVNVSFLDLDFKLLRNYHPEFKSTPDPKTWIELIYDHIEKINGCPPSLIMFTGGGVHLKWFYNQPLEAKNLLSWQYLQKLLYSQFKTLGADPASLDAARILRIAGSTNHKNAEHISDHNVKVIKYDIAVENVSFQTFLNTWEQSTPQDINEFQNIQQTFKAQIEEANKPDAKYSILREHIEHHIEPSSETKISQIAMYMIRQNLFNLHTARASWIHINFPDGCSEFIPTSQVYDYMKFFYPNSEVKLSAVEFEDNKHSNPEIKYIPCSYVTLSNCPGDNLIQQLENIKKRCLEYRDVGFPEPNQIIQIGRDLCLEWVYSDALPGYAFSRWEVTQEFIAHHFEDWGAMYDDTVMLGKSHLPIPGLTYNGNFATLIKNEKINYTFDDLARKVLHFSQKQVEDYKDRKMEKVGILTPFRKLMQMIYQDQRKRDFAPKARQRYVDLMKLMDYRRDLNGNVPQGNRELFVFIAAVCAIQGKLIQCDEKSIDGLLQSLINHCGKNFKDECNLQTFGTLKRKFLAGDNVIYKFKTASIIDLLQITPKEQKKLYSLKLLEIPKKKSEPREQWLAKHSTEREKPWLKLKISRATWYRRKSAGLIA